MSNPALIDNVRLAARLAAASRIANQFDCSLYLVTLGCAYLAETSDDDDEDADDIAIGGTYVVEADALQALFENQMALEEVDGGAVLDALTKIDGHEPEVSN